MEYDEIMEELRSLANPVNVEGMARFGINPQNTLGIPVTSLRKIGRKLGRNHRLAGELWKSGVHEARILASIIDEPAMVTEKQMDDWAGEFDSWDVCDQCCINLFRKTAFAWGQASKWCECQAEFVKRAGFALIATLAVHEKNRKDSEFEEFLLLIKKGAADERNFVKKAVNWALRQMGKRNSNLNSAAIKVAGEISAMSSKSARWIAKDALRELKSEAVMAKFRSGNGK